MMLRQSARWESSIVEKKGEKLFRAFPKVVLRQIV
jgi:hypothetical protein